MAAIAPTHVWLEVNGRRFELAALALERDKAPDPGWYDQALPFARYTEGAQVLAVSSPDLEMHLREAGRLRQAVFSALAEAEDAVGRNPQAQAALALFRDLLLARGKAMGG